MDLATIIGILVAFGLVIAALGGDAVLFFDFASILIVGVVSGTTIVALHLSLAAENATPCAWLPADAVITPCLSCAAVS